MNITAPDPLKMLDRTPAGLGALPSAEATSAPAKSTWKSGDLQPGESFSHLLGRQRVTKADKTTTSSPANGPQPGETTADYLNGSSLSGAAGNAASVTTPQWGETTSQFLNRAHVVKSGEAAASSINAAAVMPENKVKTTPPIDLNKQKTLDAADTETLARQTAEKAAGDLASNALILPMLKQLRRSPWGENTLFSGGIGEKAFGPEFDMQIADRIAHSPRLGVTQALASRLMQRKTPEVMKLSDSKKLDVHG